jgi:hypothetical protein
VDQLVCYSVFLSREAPPPPDLLRQLLASVQTLRQYDERMPVVVFAYDDAQTAIEPMLAPYDVRVVPRGSYEERVKQLCPQGWTFLSKYPVLHKSFNFDAVAAMQPRQVLLLDCDTLFFDDVAQLFARYGDAHCYAREEPSCSRSPHGYRPEYLDEAVLLRAASTLGVHALPPFNLGVLLLNHGVWSALAELLPAMMDYVWRLLLGIAIEPRERPAPDDAGLAAWVRQQQDALPAWAAASPPLPFPSTNEWILEQVAFWLALGHVPDLRYADFSPSHVVQNGELFAEAAPPPESVLCHYFSGLTARVEEWLRACPLFG